MRMPHVVLLLLATAGCSQTPQQMSAPLSLPPTTAPANCIRVGDSYYEAIARLRAKKNAEPDTSPRGSRFTSMDPEYVGGLDHWVIRTHRQVAVIRFTLLCKKGTDDWRIIVIEIAPDEDTNYGIYSSLEEIDCLNLDEWPDSD